MTNAIISINIFAKPKSWLALFISRFFPACDFVTNVRVKHIKCLNQSTLIALSDSIRVHRSKKIHITVPIEQYFVFIFHENEKLISPKFQKPCETEQR